MKDPEISTRITELKNGFQQETDKKLAEFDKHGERLARLEEDFGFDLDIATDIYGDKLLDPLDTENVLEKWEQLLAKIAKNPGGDLLLVRQVEVSTGVYSVAHSSSIKYSEKAVEVAIVKNIQPENIVYVPADPENNIPAHIAVLGDVSVSYPAREPGYSRGLIEPPGSQNGIMLAEQTEGIRLLDGSSGLASYDVSFIYDPTSKEAYDLINSKIEDALQFPIHIIEQIHERNETKS
ncbi:hypothetical protein HY004_02360 [Candidatus Saccharibacteria bacterium]|nr:hypothetical protein [Candidatus Saccharibacteria bacterium]